MASSQHQKTENPICPSIAIELTSRNITAYFDDEVATKTMDKPINFKDNRGFKALGQQLQDLSVPDRIRKRIDTFWTIGIPDNASPEARKGIKDAFDEFRRLSIESPEDDLLAFDNEKFKIKPYQPPIRLINRSTAGAISYLQSLRDQERLNTENEEDVAPYLPSRHFLTIFVDGRQIYGSEFETLDGLVQHKQNFHFKDENFKKCMIQVEEADEEILITVLNSLWTNIYQDLKNEKVSSDIPIIFTYNTTTYLIQNNSGIQAIPPEYYYTPADKFSLFPSINNKFQQWNVTNRFILKGINVKTRMLAGDADMIDYDVPSGFVGEATIECKDIFRASLIRDCEQLPIHRTIFETTKPIFFEVDVCIGFDYRLNYKLETPRETFITFICKVDENGIFKSFDYHGL